MRPSECAISIRRRLVKYLLDSEMIQATTQKQKKREKEKKIKQKISKIHLKESRRKK